MALARRVAMVILITAAIIATASCAQEPAKSNATLVALKPRYQVAPGRVAIQNDPDHPIRIPYELYPPESRRLGEEGSCLVRLTVGTVGNVTNEEISVSSGSPRLDQACLDAYRSARFVPATQNGIPIVDTVEMPVNWRLPH